MREKIDSVPVRRLGDVVEKMLASKLEVSIKVPEKPLYIETLTNYIDEAYEVVVFHGKQMYPVEGLLITNSGKKCPIITAKGETDKDKTLMYCLYPKCESEYFIYVESDVATKEEMNEEGSPNLGES